MAKRLGTDKDTQKLLNAAEKQGWTISITKGNHIKCVPPTKDGQILIGALTGTPTGMKKFRASLMKQGVAA
jgi:hypothetical protein